MILLCGIPTESPLALVSKALDKHDVPYVLLNQRKFSIMKAQVGDFRRTSEWQTPDEWRQLSTRRLQRSLLSTHGLPISA
jgi:hypothetical protein